MGKGLYRASLRSSDAVVGETAKYCEHFTPRQRGRQGTYASPQAVQLRIVPHIVVLQCVLSFPLRRSMRLAGGRRLIALGVAMGRCHALGHIVVGIIGSIVV